MLRSRGNFINVLRIVEHFDRPGKFQLMLGKVSLTLRGIPIKLKIHAPLLMDSTGSQYIQQRPRGIVTMRARMAIRLIHDLHPQSSPIDRRGNRKAFCRALGGAAIGPGSDSGIEQVVGFRGASHSKGFISRPDSDVKS